MANPKTSTQVQDSELAAFDWRNQWYPVHFARDLPEGQPQRVYIFDEPIVVLKGPGNQGVVALRDRCPHRAAALSEGRMTPDGQLQCAYHGWSFDGQSGICTNIPQVPHLTPALQHKPMVASDHPLCGHDPCTSTRYAIA